MKILLVEDDLIASLEAGTSDSMRKPFERCAPIVRNRKSTPTRRRGMQEERRGKEDR
jgi:hypothetical protein